MRKPMAIVKANALISKLLILLAVICITSLNCAKEEEKTKEPVKPVDPFEIKQPANPFDPAVMPDTTTMIVKYDGEFTPLLTDILANWRVVSAIRFQSNWHADCWSATKETTYTGVPRDMVKGKSVNYKSCHALSADKTFKPDFSADASVFWGQYRKGVEVWDSAGHDYTSHPNYPYGYHYISGDPLVRYHRYYTVPDLPDAYIMMEKKWEIIPIQGSDFAHCEGCSSIEKTTTTTTGLKVDKTKEWGYTLGYEYTIGADVKFINAAHKLGATISQKFQTTISQYEEMSETLTLKGTMPFGKNIIRLQSFREVSTFKLVDKDGNDYYPGVITPVIDVTTLIKNYVWYY
ncbi:MAG: hypothetical protein R6V49_09320 [Bacteroidales bacterium]